MEICRESKNKYNLVDDIPYKESMYNIEVCQFNKKAIFNSASSAVVIIDEDYDMLSSKEDEKHILAENGFIVPNNINEYEKFISNIEIAKKNNLNFFTIIPTTACNAKCFYCYEENYCKKSITKESNEKIIDFLAKNIDENSKCVLDWYGGEPLLCVNKIDEIIDKLISMNKLKNNNWSSSITTNGTLLTKNLISHMTNKWHLESAHITIDGVEEEHNRRKNVSLNGESAFKKTHDGILELLKSGVYVNLRIHLDNHNKDSFSKILDSISDLMQFDNLHLFPTYLFPPEHEMADSYIKDFEKEDFFYDVFKALLNSNNKITLKDLFPKAKFNGCLASKSNAVVIAPDGTTHACVQDFSSVDKNDTEKYHNFKYALEECKECPFLPICLGGCLYNRNLSNTMRTPCVRNRFVVKPLLKLLLEKNNNEGN